ncbi:sodium:proton antiporter [Propionigenium maris DSM 9537]|uniref:Sodium:proton antiporter n=1 Tax=Propionigenium maris DSM 9537 TaxID=1123000 RepID=A0A9W6LMI8_9FUSO|nr:sodium:proton antiporter [Propionigenium maris DSM 9537]
MDITLSMVVIFFLLIFSIINNIFIAWPLGVALLIFGFLSLRRGHTMGATLRMALEGGRKSFIVLQVFILIGILTSVWISAGTIPAIVYYGIRLMNPSFFILSAFVITSFVSFLLGTSLGTVSTIGVALIVMARAGDINMALVTGAIMSGAYFGDRCSPMSSSAILVANLTKTDIFDNIRDMFKTSILPLLISALLYLGFSLRNPIVFRAENIGGDLASIFHIGPLSFLPAAIILLASLFRIRVKKSMTLSIVAAAVLSVIVEGYSPQELLHFSIFGFRLEEWLLPGNILNRGGVISMLRAGIVVFISCSMAGIFNGTKMLDRFHTLYTRARDRYHLFLYTIATSILTSVFGCNQTIAIVLTEQLLDKTYEKKEHSRGHLAIDLENTAVVIAPLIPWNIAAFMPTSTLGVNFYTYVPYAFYLYLLPLTNLLLLKYKRSAS